MLDGDGRRAVDEARAAALHELRREHAEREAPAGLGLPSSDDAVALVAMVAWRLAASGALPQGRGRSPQVARAPLGAPTFLPN